MAEEQKYKSVLYIVRRFYARSLLVLYHTYCFCTVKCTTIYTVGVFKHIYISKYSIFSMYVVQYGTVIP
jgi:hypothetical protein